MRYFLKENHENSKYSRNLRGNDNVGVITREGVVEVWGC